jgi:hypothetical protein
MGWDGMDEGLSCRGTLARDEPGRGQRRRAQRASKPGRRARAPAAPEHRRQKLQERRQSVAAASPRTRLDRRSSLPALPITPNPLLPVALAMSSLISALAWVRQGASQRHPTRYDLLDPNELARVSALARVELEDAKAQLEAAEGRNIVMGEDGEDNAAAKGEDWET